MLTFLDLQNEVLRYIDEGDDASTGTTRALVKDAINRSHRQVLMERAWPFMTWPGEQSFTTVAGRRTYALPHGVGKILTLWDDDWNVPTPMISRREWESLGVNRTDNEDVPYGVIYGDTWPIPRQPEPDIGQGFQIVSSSASDTGGPGVVLTGIIYLTGAYATQVITATGTTPVGSHVDYGWSHILSVTKTGTWVGNMTLTGGSGQTITLTPSEYGRQYPTLEFIETPNVARTYLYTAMRTPRVLTYDYDIPDTPYPFSMIHAYDALLDLTAYNTELGAKEQRLWESRRTKLWNDLVASVDETIAGSRPRFVRRVPPPAGRRMHRC